MKNMKLLLGALAIAGLMTGCPTNPPVTVDAGVDGGGTHDGGPDSGPGPDTGMGDGGGVDMGMADMGPPDTGVPVDCATYCTTITAACTTTNAQYADMAACMTACTAAGWTPGSAADTAGNTLGCRIYHAMAASGNAALHCPHAGPLGGAGQSTPGPCSPFRQDPAVEGHPTATEGAYVRVDRMGMPAVATALVGPGTADTPAGTVAALKDTYNDSNPSADATFANAIPMLTAIGAYHFLLDADLRSLNLTPCSVAHTFPIGLAAPVPACALQHWGSATPISAAGGLAGTVASLIIPDTLRIDTSTATAFPNGRAPDDDVINPTLSVLLLALTPCSGSPTGTDCSAFTSAGMTACNGHAGCSFVAGACTAAAGSRAATCAGLSGALCTGLCVPAGSACVPAPCEALDAATCGAQTGCGASTCGGSQCTAHSLDAAGLTPHTGDHPASTTFPYFAAPN